MLNSQASFRSSLFHVKQSATCACAVAPLMFYMKHYQSGRPPRNLLIAGSHEYS